MYKTEGFVGRKGLDKEVISKRGKKDYFRQGHLPLGGKLGGPRMQTTSLELIRKFQTEWFKILPGEAETTLRLGIKSWWGLTEVTLFWACCSF